MSIIRHCPASFLAIYYGIVAWLKLNRNLIIPGEVEVAIVKSTPEEALKPPMIPVERHRRRSLSPASSDGRLGLFPKGTELSRCSFTGNGVLSYLFICMNGGGARYRYEAADSFPRPFCMNRRGFGYGGSGSLTSSQMRIIDSRIWFSKLLRSVFA